MSDRERIYHTVTVVFSIRKTTALTNLDKVLDGGSRRPGGTSPGVGI
jgi:hypothetical protein